MVQMQMEVPFYRQLIISAMAFLMSCKIIVFLRGKEKGQPIEGWQFANAEGR